MFLLLFVDLESKKEKRKIEQELAPATKKSRDQISFSGCSARDLRDSEESLQPFESMLQNEDQDVPIWLKNLMPVEPITATDANHVEPSPSIGSSSLLGMLCKRY